MLRPSLLLIYRLIIPLACSDIISRDFKLNSKKICKSGCSKIICYPNTLISIDSIKKFSSTEESKCSPNDSLYSVQEYNCHFKVIENHIFKTCSNTYSCEICPDKIDLKLSEQSTFCSSEFDFEINYRCIPSFIKNDNVCAHSYLDLNCFDHLDERLVILNATIISKIKATADDQRGCRQSNNAQLGIHHQCYQYDRTNQAISKCSFRDKCSIGPRGFTPPQCGNMHMKISYACVTSSALNYYNKKRKESDQQVISLISETKEDNISWFNKQKWKILGISSSIMVVISVLISLTCFFLKRTRERHNCHVNSPKDNLFNKLGQVKFSPPPSSIDKVNMDYDENFGLPDMYHSNSDGEEINIRSIYSSKLPSTLSYNSPFCIAAPTINTCQYFQPLMSPGHINMLDMPPIQQASSGNLTSSTTNSSHGTPRGTKSSGIFSMNDTSFEISHQV